jgi:hypothetical protein
MSSTGKLSRACWLAIDAALDSPCALTWRERLPELRGVPAAEEAPKLLLRGEKGRRGRQPLLCVAAAAAVGLLLVVLALFA